MLRDAGAVVILTLAPLRWAFAAPETVEVPVRTEMPRVTLVQAVEVQSARTISSEELLPSSITIPYVELARAVPCLSVPRTREKDAAEEVIPDARESS